MNHKVEVKWSGDRWTVEIDGARVWTANHGVELEGAYSVADELDALIREGLLNAEQVVADIRRRELVERAAQAVL